ncbi:GNAT family N-acetyltransferase [Sunxiuqinia sp. A32]|uniref:GNAT family N-acetyltransferase n=1 Tax=Sunxiuqinia sp. A32 TaxID=3461496 RepID=UPI004045216A
MTDYPIHQAQVSDLKELVLLEQLAFEQESFSRRQMRYLLTKAQSDYVIIRVEGQLAASLILLKKKNSSYLRIYSLLVSPEYRGVGLAKKLLDYAERQAAVYEKNALSLEVSDSNTAAVTLYLKWGFQTVAEKPKYYKDGSTGLVMRKIF